MRAAALAVAGALLLACAGNAPRQFDYANFRQHPPRSILVLPPLNNGADVRGTYGDLSTLSRPLAEMGYYVFPVALVDQFLKENGLPGPGEMHQAPLDKLASIFGADAVLYVTLEEYGTKYNLLSSYSIVREKAKLVDAKTGLVLWEGGAAAAQDSGSGGGGLVGALVSAAVSQVFNSNADTAHAVSRQANMLMFGERRPFGSGPGGGGAGPALLPGPYLPAGETVR